MLEREFGLKTDVVAGGFGEFSVLVDGEPVVRRALRLGLPGMREILEAVRRRIAPSASPEPGA